ncbi:LuxR C-terminal-related transcriptional regulator [Sporosarcina sp.]|uniref:LuxR C-terminal-related transcriptional regulator n=1 Tax=Sporosarcina sp. TaxID=49982 RepID=UPI0026115569|nr:LuxR C-terminal-related transcriptional regulator [Sporosarcina sp.]
MVWLDSKIAVPKATLQTVDRNRLIDLLHTSGPRRLTIVRAPAGYGKSTLISQWVTQLHEHIVWLSIDETDNDPIRFWKYVIRAVSEIAVGETKLHMLALFNEQSPLEVLIDSFMNEIESFQGNIHIVMDDYHVIVNPVIHDIMARFIDYLPTNTYVYLTSRTDLPLPFAKWRVKGWLTEIGVDQLRFTYDEVERYYVEHQIPYDNTELLSQVFRKTEGWAAGLQLVGLAGKYSTTDIMDTTGFNHPHPFATEFLLQEILASLPPIEQDFLLRTSILDQLDHTICDALTNRDDSLQILLELEKKGLFIIRLHDSKPIFRFHHLFADALQVELMHRYSDEVVSLLYQDAAASLLKKGDFNSAIELALKGQLYEVADTLITAHLLEIFTIGQTSTFNRWMQVLRDNDYLVNVETLVMYVITLATSYEMEEASRLIMELDQLHEVDQWMDSEDYRGMGSILDTIRAFVLLAGGKDIDQSMKIIGEQLDKGRTSSRWDDIPMQYNWLEPTLLRTSVGGRGKLLWPDEILPLLAFFQEADTKEKNMTGFAYGVAAETSFHRNALDQSLLELEAALQFGHHFKDPGLYIPMYILKARVYVSKNQFVEAHAVLEYALETTTERHWLDSLRTMEAYVYLLEGNILQAEQKLFASTGLNNPTAESEKEFWLLMTARLLLAKGQAADALKRTIRVKEIALKERQVLTIIEATILEAVCQVDLGNEEAAFLTLHNALKEGAPYGYSRIFLDEMTVMSLLGKYLKMRRLGLSAKWDTVPITYVEKLIAESQIEPVENPMLASLTPRERSLLDLVATGATNSEIAQELLLSEGTVRVYLTNVYSKLGVNSRTKAILVAKGEAY